MTTDFRTKFGISVFDVGRGVSYTEGLLLLAGLLKDPTSMTQAAKAKWKHPASWEWMTLASLYDATVIGNWSGKGRKPKTFPRPWPNKDTQRIGATTISLPKAKNHFASLGYNL